MKYYLLFAILAAAIFAGLWLNERSQNRRAVQLLTDCTELVSKQQEILVNYDTQLHVFR